MNYVATRAKPNPAALAGALGVPAAFAALLVAGLAVTDAIPDIMPTPETTFIEDEVVEITPVTDLPERPIDPSVPTTPSEVTLPPRPDRQADAPFEFGDTPPIDALPDLDGGLGNAIGEISTTPLPSFADPVSAKPRGNPGEWVTDADYRSRWIREGLSGTARFRDSLPRGARG